MKDGIMMSDNVREIVLDTETTGLSPKEGHRVIEIGALELINHMPTGQQLHLYINPEREIDEGAEKVHGISSSFLADNLFLPISLMSFLPLSAKIKWLSIMRLLIWGF